MTAVDVVMTCFFDVTVRLSVVAGQVEDCGGSGRPDPLPPRGGAAQADHCDPEGNA